jgi:glycosyltransferase involved in cell wall biosynthesis
LSYGALATYLAASDLAWLPLKDSGANRGRLPLKLNDFMAAGRAIVATDVGDVGALLRCEPVGRLSPDEAEPLARAVLDLLADDEERARLGQDARRLAETKLSWSRMADRLERFYLRIWQEGGGRNQGEDRA